MRKQTKLVAVLSTAALLAIGASMTSFAATGWQEENGTWVYYDRDEERVTQEWRKSGDNWFWLDDNGEMAVDQLIEDDDDYYYVNEAGAMVSNQWVAIENEDAGEEDEPEYWWYYFQANGKAYKDSGNSDNASWKLINGKYYTFNEDGQMQYGWLNHDGERQTGDDDWAQQSGTGSDNAMYYCGDENDGARTEGWRLINIYDEDWDPDSYENGDIYDEDQDRWFYFKSNGTRVQDDDKTINGRKYQFDEYGRMLPMWVYTGTPSNMTTQVGSLNNATKYEGDAWGTVTKDSQGNPTYSSEWKYFGDPEDGARVTKGWFKCVPSEYLQYSKSDEGDNQDYWYYSNGDGELYANEIKTIKGKKYAFDSYGRMIDGLRILAVSKNDGNKIVEVYNTDAYDTEDKFDEFYNMMVRESADTDWRVYTYYFGDADDGSMKTGTQTVELDGDDLSFEFEKSGSKKGRGKNDYDNDSKKCYIGGKVAKADSDEKYEIVLTYESGDIRQFSVSDLAAAYGLEIESWDEDNKGDKTGEYYALKGSAAADTDMGDKDNYEKGSLVDTLNANIESDKADDEYKALGDVEAAYVVNTSGSAQDKKKSKNGDDMYIVSTKRNISKPDVTAIYSED